MTAIRADDDKNATRSCGIFDIKSMRMGSCVATMCADPLMVTVHYRVSVQGTFGSSKRGFGELLESLNIQSNPKLMV